MNYRNYTQNTNFVAGSEKLKILPFFLTDLNLPGFNLTAPEAYNRGMKINMMPDSISFNDLSITAIVDEDFKLYEEITDIVFQYINPETGTMSGTTFPEFDFWIEINNAKGNKLLKIEYYNCKIVGLGDLGFDTKDEGNIIMMPIEIRYDYFKIVKN